MRLLLFLGLAVFGGTASSLQGRIDAIPGGGSGTLAVAGVEVLETTLVITEQRHVRLVGPGTIQGPEGNSTEWKLIRANDASLTLEDVTILGRGTTRGCVELVSGASLELTGSSTIRGCTNTNDGGAISAARSSIKLLSRSVVAESATNANGGCFALDDQSTLDVGANAAVVGCHADGNGGGAALGVDSMMLLRDDAQIERNSASGMGGAVSLRRASLRVFDRAQIANNHAEVYAGGVDVQLYSRLLLQDESRLVRNSAGDWGGGAYAWGQSGIECRNSTLVANNTAHEGGGLFIAEYDVSYDESTTYLWLYDQTLVTNNHAALSGGGIKLRGWSSDLLMNDTAAVTNNIAKNGHGGGIECVGGSIVMTGRSVISYNRAVDGGAISILSDASISTSETTELVGNHALGGGGGLAISDSWASLMGTVRENQAYKGGGLFIWKGLVGFGGLLVGNHAETNAGGAGLDSSTTFTFEGTGAAVVDNSASGDGGGVVLLDPASSLLGTGRFLGNLAERSGGCLMVAALAVLNASGYEFRDCQAGDKGGAILVEKSAKVAFDDAVVVNASARSGAAIAVDVGAVVSVDTSVIRDCEATDFGGCTYAEDGAKVDFRSTTVNASAATDGGAFYSAGADVTTKSCIFDGTTAWRNGGVFFARDGASVSTLNDDFRRSAAAGGGGAILFFDHTTMERPAMFEAALRSSSSRVDGVQATYGPLIATPVARIIASHDPNVLEVGGSKTNLIAPLEVRAYDFFSQLVKTAATSVDIRSDSPVSDVFDLDGVTKVDFDGGIASTRTLRIADRPNATVRLVLSTGDLESRVSIRLRLCAPGEVVASDEVTCTPCEAHTYYDGETCRPCGGGMVCRAALEDRLIETVALQRGYWRANLLTSTIEKCHTSENCPAGRGAGNTLCSAHASGVLCNECDRGFYLGPSHKCQPCRQAWPALALVAFLGSAVALFELRTQRDHVVASPHDNGGFLGTPGRKSMIRPDITNLMNSQTRPGIASLMNSAKAAWWGKAMLFLWLSLQTIGIFVENEEIGLKQPFGDLVGILTKLTDFGDATKCIEFMDYFGNMFLNSMLPIFIGGALAIAAGIRCAFAYHAGSSTATRAARNRIVTQHMQASIYTVLLLHTPVCVNLSNFFDCDGPFESGDGGDKVYLLHTNYKVQCNSMEYRKWLPYVVVMFLFYVVVSAEIKLQFRSFVGLHFLFSDSRVVCVLEVVIILVETKNFYTFFLFLVFGFSDFFFFISFQNN